MYLNIIEIETHRSLKRGCSAVLCYIEIVWEERYNYIHTLALWNQGYVTKES